MNTVWSDRPRRVSVACDVQPDSDRVYEAMMDCGRAPLPGWTPQHKSPLFLTRF